MSDVSLWEEIAEMYFALPSTEEAEAKILAYVEQLDEFDRSTYKMVSICFDMTSRMFAINQKYPVDSYHLVPSSSLPELIQFFDQPDVNTPQERFDANPELVEQVARDVIEYFQLTIYNDDIDEGLVLMPHEDPALQQSADIICNIMPAQKILGLFLEITLGAIPDHGRFIYVIADIEANCFSNKIPQNNPSPHKYFQNSNIQTVIEARQKKAINFLDYRETEDVVRVNQSGDFETSQGDVFVTGEDGIIEKICQEYRISTFEADEILQAHRSFERSTHSLKAKYSIKFLEQTEDFLKQRERSKENTGFFGKISKMTTRIPREVQAMWSEYEACRREHKSLIKTIETYELPKATQQRPESIITTVYNVRNEAKDIANPQSAMEGRRIFDTLRRQENLLDRLGI